MRVFQRSGGFEGELRQHPLRAQLRTGQNAAGLQVRLWLTVLSCRPVHINRFVLLRALFFGENEIAVRVPPLFKLLIKEVSSCIPAPFVHSNYCCFS